MSDLTPDDSLVSERLAKALSLPDWDALSDAELEEFLDNAEPLPLSKAQHDRILDQAKRLIRQWETQAMATHSDIPQAESTAHLTPASRTPSSTPQRSRQKASANRKGSGSGS